MSPLHAFKSRSFRLPELVDAAKALLGDTRIEVSDDRVQLFPDARTVRYYQSLGILPPPDRYEGRTAIYGFTHLLRATCTKLLQSQGFSLSQVQTGLSGATDPELERTLESALQSKQAEARPQIDDPSPSVKPQGPVSVRSLYTAEIALGVTVTIDPSVVPDPQAIFSQLASAIHTPHRG